MMKKILIWIVIIAVVVMTGAYLARNWIVANAITKGSTYALGVNAHLGSANLSLGAGSLELRDYELDNPPDYDSVKFMSIKSGVVSLSYGSVFSDTVVVDSLVLDGIKVTLIQRGEKGNFTQIMDYARKMEYDTSSSTTLVRINKVNVRNIAVDASLKILNQVNVDKSFEIEDITLTNVGGTKGATIGEIASIVFKEILSKSVIRGKGQLSSEFGQGIDKLEKKGMEKAGEEAVEKVKDLGTSLLGGDKKKK